MKEELQQKLYRDFPKLYGCPDKQGFYFECDDGWYELIYDLSKKITEIIEKTPVDENFPIRAAQVKEKYGTLRFYMETETDEISDLIYEYEQLSAKTCEVCGKPGRIRGGRWVQSLCDEHAKK